MCKKDADPAVCVNFIAELSLVAADLADGESELKPVLHSITAALTPVSKTKLDDLQVVRAAIKGSHAVMKHWSSLPLGSLMTKRIDEQIVQLKKDTLAVVKALCKK